MLHCPAAVARCCSLPTAPHRWLLPRAELVATAQAVRMATHPAAWAPVAAGLWDAVATASCGPAMRAQLVLTLGTLLPTEARLSYLALRHAAYADGKETATLGGLVKKVRPGGGEAHAARSCRLPPVAADVTAAHMVPVSCPAGRPTSS